MSEPAVRRDEIEYTVEGRRYVGHLAVPDGEELRPAVLVCHEGPGLDDHARGRADRIAAELGMVAFALDYHGDGTPLPMDQVMARIGALRDSPDTTRKLGRAGLDVLLANDHADPARVAAIGYCFGGTMALELARDGADLAAVVGFHSGLATSAPAAAGAITARVLVCIGADDPLIPPDQRATFEEEMRACGADWQMHVYGGAVHSFTNRAADRLNRPGIAYHRTADERSWRAMVDLFDEVW